MSSEPQGGRQLIVCFLNRSQRCSPRSARNLNVQKGDVMHELPNLVRVWRSGGTASVREFCCPVSLLIPRDTIHISLRGHPKSKAETSMQVAARASIDANMYFPRYNLKNVIYNTSSREQKLTISSKLESTREPGEVNATTTHYEPNTNTKQPWDHLSQKSHRFQVKRCRSRFGSNDA